MAGSRSRPGPWRARSASGSHRCVAALGRWQNIRRLNLALGLITLRGRGEAREARYAKLVRAQFEARGNRSHLPAENTLPLEVWRDQPRQMSWWRTWQDRGVASLPHLVRESERRAKRRAADEHVLLARERLEVIYATQVDIRDRLGIPVPPTGRPKRPIQEPRESVRGKVLGEFEDLMAEWDWDFNGDLDPMNLPAGSKIKVAWRCLLNEDHVWETRVAGRTLQQAFCPFHMGNKVHPSESLAAYFPWLAKEWHPTKNALRPDLVTRASGHEVHWICEVGHEWPAVAYSRTLSASGCPECFRLGSAAKAKAGVRRRRTANDDRVEKQVALVISDTGAPAPQ